MNITAIARLLFPPRTMPEMLRDYAESHGIHTRKSGDTYQVLSIWTQHGVPGQEWVDMPTTYQGMRDFLNY